MRTVACLILIGLYPALAVMMARPTMSSEPDCLSSNQPVGLGSFPSTSRLVRRPARYSPAPRNNEGHQLSPMDAKIDHMLLITRSVVCLIVRRYHLDTVMPVAIRVLPSFSVGMCMVALAAGLSFPASFLSPFLLFSVPIISAGVIAMSEFVDALYRNWTDSIRRLTGGRFPIRRARIPSRT